MTRTDYDSEEDTRLHIAIVYAYLMKCSDILTERGQKHDQSKLKEPEKSFFDKYTPLLASLNYGSDEYNQSLAELKPALQHHYAANRHHPEHFTNRECIGCFKEFPDDRESCCDVCGNPIYPNVVGVEAMNLFDVLEMLVDWKAASERHGTGDIRESLEINIKRFRIKSPLASILLNTIDTMGW